MTMSLERRIEQLEKRTAPKKDQYPADGVILVDDSMTREDIDRIMEERHERSGITNFILLD